MNYETLLTLDIARLIPLLIVFLFAARQDHKTGLVSDKHWLYIAIGCPVMLIEYALFSTTILVVGLVSAAVCIAISLALAKMGNGGADTAALITLALCYPLSPIYNYRWMPMFPMAVWGLAAIFGVTAMVIKRQRQIRFLPYAMAALTILAVV